MSAGRRYKPSPATGWRRYRPGAGGPRVTDGEMGALIVANLVATIGLAGDIASHLTNPTLEEDFLAGWHLVLYGGVAMVGAWLGIGAIRRGPAFVGSLPTTVIGFVLLTVGGATDAVWHEVFGVEVAVEALVSPPHLVILTGLVFLLTSPMVVLWKRPDRSLGIIASIAALVSVVSTVLVVMLFTGFLSPLAGGMSLQAGYVEPLLGESFADYDQVRGLGIAVWSTTVLVGAFTVLMARFRLLPGSLLAGLALVGLAPIFVSGLEGWPLLVGFVAAGVVAELGVAAFGRPTLGRVGASITGAAIGISLWSGVFASLAADDRLAWSEALWGGTITLSGMIGAAVAGLVALPMPTGASPIDDPAERRRCDPSSTASWPRRRAPNAPRTLAGVTDFVVITGLSGAGRSTAADVLEDQDWFVIDNMPIELMPRVGELALAPGSEISRVAFVVGSNSDSDQLDRMLADLRASGSWVRVLYLDARSDVLIRRYEGTRRRHPASAGELLGAAIEQERTHLDRMRAIADVVVDTSDLNVHQLRDRVSELFADDASTPGMQVTVVSFGFKHGLPPDVDMVLDCRFLPNPHWVDELRSQTGQDEAVRDYVLGSDQAGDFLDHLDGLLDVLLPGFQAERKAYLTLAFGCTGGRHRSVAIGEEVARRLRDRGFQSGVTHRDVAKVP